MSELEQLRQLLEKHGASVTKPRLHIFQTLQQTQKPLKAGEIARLTSAVNRASVYRTLELFSKLGITTTVTRGWIPYIELAEPFRAHHHHLECSTCGRHYEINSEALEEAVRTLATTHNFHLQQHTVELTGVCAGCQGARASD